MRKYSFSIHLFWRKPTTCIFIVYNLQSTIHICFLSASNPKRPILKYWTLKYHFQCSRLPLIDINNKQLSTYVANQIVKPLEIAVLPIRHVRRKVQCDVQTMIWKFFRNCCYYYCCWLLVLHCILTHDTAEMEKQWHWNRVNNQINSQVNCVYNIP